MTLLVLMALVGAAAGVWIKPRPAALPLALAAAAAVRALAGVLAPMAVGEVSAPFYARIAFSFVEDTADDYLPLLGVAGGSALFATLLSAFVERRSRGTMTLEESTRARRQVRQGKFVRARGMIEPRESQSKAEERQRALLDL